jgi:hypothetical protein
LAKTRQYYSTTCVLSKTVYWLIRMGIVKVVLRGLIGLSIKEISIVPVKKKSKNE